MFDYESALQYLYQQLPVFHRVGAAAYKPGLDNTFRLLELLGNPQHELRYVHVAGTNGKGSTSHLIASSLQSADYSVGLYTSPHLVDFRERIRFNGQMIPREAVVQFVQTFSEAWKPIQPSFFELTVAMCFWYLREVKPDIVVLEVGMGGRLDSTNVIQPELCVITNIGLDHQQYLGDTIEKIAAEKAGIIKPQIPVVLGAMLPAARHVIHQWANQNGSPWIDASECEAPPSPLAGSYQGENRKTAAAALRQLRKQGWNVQEEHIVDGFAKVMLQTGIQGRWQTLHDSPRVIVDVGHNEDGLRWIVRQLSETPHQRLHWVLGVVNDKDLAAMLSLLPQTAIYYFCKADIPRGLPASELHRDAALIGLQGEVYPSVRTAYDAALHAAGQDDLVFVGGSFFTVAEVL